MSVPKILRAAFEKKKRENKKVSLQAIANRVGISRPLLSQVMAGKRNLPLERLDALAQALDLDKEKRDSLAKLLLGRKKVSVEPSLVGGKAPAGRKDWLYLDRRQAGVLQDWFYLAVLEATLLEDYDGTTAFLARRLGLEPALVERAMAVLTEQKMVEARGKKRVKRGKLYDFHSGADQRAIRTYHAASMQKATRELMAHTEPGDVAQRLVTGMTLAISRDRVPYVQQKIADLLVEVAEDAAENPAQEVYQLAVQFLPLSRK